MKKLIALFVVVAFLFASVGCGGSPTTKTGGTGGTGSTEKKP